MGGTSALSIGGDHLLGEELGDGDGLSAVGAFAAEADLAHERGAVGAALLADGAVGTAVAFVDGDGPSWPALRDPGHRPRGVASASVGGGAAGVGAELLASGGGEGVLADGTGDRDGIVTDGV